MSEEPYPAQAETIRILERFTVVRRTYQSVHHLWSAHHFAALAQAEEADPGPVPRSNARHLAYVHSAIISASAFMEAAVNEVFQDAADGHKPYLAGLTEQACQAMSVLWKASDDGQKYIGVLDKYDLARVFAGRSPADRSSNPWADARTVVTLRNWLIHSRPKDFSEETSHKLGDQLTGKFAPNALMQGAGNPFFPDHALGAGCAAWAHQSARAYVDAFAVDLGLELPYQADNYREEPPDSI